MPRKRVVHQSLEPPIDISKPFAQGLAAAYPKGYHLLMSDNSYCPGYDEPGNVYDAPLPGGRLPGNVSPAVALADVGISRYRGNDTAEDKGWTQEALPAPRVEAGGMQGRSKAVRPAPPRAQGASARR